MEGLTRDTANEIIAKIQSLIDFDKLDFKNLEIEKIEIDVAAGTTTYTKQHVTDIVHAKVVGIALNITDEAVLEGATMSLSIDGQEVFPSGTEAKLLFASTAVPPNQKFYTYLKRDINQTRVDITYTSNGFTAAYKANFYLLCTKA
jgi:lipoate-protein ligase A